MKIVALIVAISTTLIALLVTLLVAIFVFSRPKHESVCETMTVKNFGPARSSAHSFKMDKIFDRFFPSWSQENDYKHCFKIESQNPVAVVIQSMSLRVDPTTKECMDFIQFRNPDEDYFHRHCGNVDASVYDGDETAEDSPYVHLKNEALVQIFFSKEGSPSKENIKLDVVFTAWKSCSEVKLDDFFFPCGETSTCIWFAFFNDKIIHCPYNGYLDEPFYFPYRPVNTLKMRFMQYFTLAVAVLFVFCCLYCCNCCWFRSITRLIFWMCGLCWRVSRLFFAAKPAEDPPNPPPAPLDNAIDADVESGAAEE
ncbi:Hypothetical predicted protein [Cloeon dipterum]|uniref:Uncharacterized protein n=1 Tax=Cloeon dipterum TaxID=197152 RepID=A0A8S1DCK5_9INSE|nr:Hypothetical predicted protein [Cloeon dipterum]